MTTELPLSSTNDLLEIYLVVATMNITETDAMRARVNLALLGLNIHSVKIIEADNREVC